MCRAETLGVASHVLWGQKWLLRPDQSPRYQVGRYLADSVPRLLGLEEMARGTSEYEKKYHIRYRAVHNSFLLEGELTLKALSAACRFRLGV